MLRGGRREPYMILFARACNGLQAWPGGPIPGSGYDAETIGRDDVPGSEVLLALYDVAGHRWVAMGRISARIAERAMKQLACDLAACPSAFREHLSYDRESDEYRRIASDFDQLEEEREGVWREESES
jgi:hypothetical protein